MQSVSTALAAAITGSPQQLADVRLRVGSSWSAWRGYFFGYSSGFTSIADFSGCVESWQVQAALTSDVPEVARMVVGQSVRSATIVLGRSPVVGMSAARYFSPYNTASPIYGQRVVGMDVILEAGFYTDGARSTVDYVPLLTGRVRSRRVDAAAGTCTLELVDGRAAMRRPVRLPTVVADDQATSAASLRPGLDGLWVIDQALRKAGIYASPPDVSNATARTVWAATFHGSAQPHIGTPKQLFDAGPSAPFFSRTGSWVKESLLVQPGSAGTSAYLYSTAPGVTTATTSPAAYAGFWCKGWIRVDALPAGGSSAVFELSDPAKSSTDTTAERISLFLASSGALIVVVTRGGQTISASTASGFVAASPTAFTPVMFTVEFGSAGITVNFLDYTGAMTSTTVAWSGTATSTPLETLRLHQARAVSGAVGGVAVNTYFEAWQMGWKDKPPSGFTNSQTYQLSFDPSAVLDPSLNPLTATPEQTRYEDCWQLAADVAAAEFGALTFDEDGTCRFRNRNTLKTVTTSVRNFGTAGLVDLATEETADQIRNHVIIQAQPIRLQAPGHIWHDDEIPAVPAGSTYGFQVRVDKPIASLSPTWTNGLTGATNLYRANSKKDGTGTDVGASVTVSSTLLDRHTVSIQITNATAATAYLVRGGATSPSSPWLWLYGTVVDYQQVDPDGATSRYRAHVLADVQDATSVANYDELLYETSGDPWLQTVDGCTGVAQHLLATLKDPHPLVRDVEVTFDPRLQLGDRITLFDPNVTGVADDFWVVGVDMAGSADVGATQKLTLRTA